MKQRITITLDDEILDFVDKMIEKRIFANRSHCFEFLIQREVNIENGHEGYSIFNLK